MSGMKLGQIKTPESFKLVPDNAHTDNVSVHVDEYKFVVAFQVNTMFPVPQCGDFISHHSYHIVSVELLVVSYRWPNREFAAGGGLAIDGVYPKFWREHFITQAFKPIVQSLPYKGDRG